MLFQLNINAFKGNKTIKPTHRKGRSSDLVHLAKVSDHSPLKTLTPKQMLQGLTIALAQVKARNTSENLLNEICQIKYSLFRTKEITKKWCNDIINSIEL